MSAGTSFQENLKVRSQSTPVSHTPAPWFVGAQNDALYVIVGDPPSINNDYPRHDANREPIAKIYTGDADARLIAAAPDLLLLVRALVEALKDAGGYSALVASTEDALKEHGP